MRSRILLAAASSLALAACSLHAQIPQAKSVEELRELFLHPPDAAKPMVRWWWFGPAVTKPEILRELQQMKADGIGGAELAFVYPEELDNPAKDIKNLAFLSPEMLEAVHYAQAEGRKLNLRIDITLCSGWPYGGPHITQAEAATRLKIVEVPVPPTATSAAPPKPAEGDTLLYAVLATGEPKHWDATSAQPLTALQFGPAATHRTAVFFFQSHTRQQVKRAAVAAEGFVLDPFSRQAVATHLARVGEPLLQAFGATPPYAIFSDSLEAYGADWTPTLPAEFRKRRGYDLIPHLPELAGGGTPAAEKVRHDYGLTLTELVNENYLTQIDDWAKAHHTQFRSQTYGEPAVSFSSQRLTGLIEGEGPQWRAFSTLRWASSASHVFGHEVTSGETFTWLHSPVFRATPLDMKAEADIDFIMGENSLSFHGWPYSPPQAFQPGWSLYAAANLNDNNPWHPVMPAVDAYITRISTLLRQGQPANQVAILLPTDDAWASFTPGHVTVTGAMQKLIPPALISAILSAGYNFDFIDADAINTVGLGTHQILILPPTDRIPATTLEKLAAWTKSGGKLITVGRAPSLDPAGNPIASAPFDSLLPLAVSVANEAELPAALHTAAKPDLQLDNPAAASQIGFIRRKLPNADIYFVANTSNQLIETILKLDTRFKSAQQWDPDTAATQPTWIEGQPVTLAPYESRILLFSGPQPVSDRPDDHTWLPTADLSANWQVTFPTLKKSLTEATLTDWTADPTTLHYSGEAIYSRDFTLTALPTQPTSLEIDGGTALPGAPNSAPQEHITRGPDGMPNPLVTGTGPGMHAYFDPPIREAALVTINGQPAGALWHPPYRLDITKLLKPGTNHIEIHVFNTALNAWSALPPHDFGPLKARYGDRFQMQDLNKVQPISSGILGTIHLVTQALK